MKEAILAFLIALVIGAAINGMNGAGHDANPSPQEQPAAAAPATAAVDSLPETTDSSWQTDVLQSQQPVLVDFYSDACVPCKEMAPVVSKLAASMKDKVHFYRLDTDRNSFTVGKYNVQTIPTFIVFKDGKVADSYTGVVPEDALREALNKVL